VTRTARDISSNAAEVIASLRALGSEMDRLDEVAAQLYGLNRTDMRALDVIGRSGPLAPSELARSLGFTTGGITTVLDRLERAGYVRRRPDPTDRRRLLVEVTEATTKRDQAVFGGLIRATVDFARGYSDDDLNLVLRFLDGTRDLTAAHSHALEGGKTKTRSPHRSRRSRVSG
jgi:DNA-binding MarR family transcriptional regulator